MLRSNHSPSNSEADDELAGSWDAIIEEVGSEVAEISMVDFADTLLPRIPCSEEVLQRIVLWVKEESGEYSRGRWTAFKQDPTSYKIKDDQVFSRLGGIVNAVQRAVEACASGILELKTRYTRVPCQAPDLSHLSNLSYPGGCFILNRPRSAGDTIPNWMDIALTGEFSKDENVAQSINDNIKKALWNIHRTMREDLTRTRAWSFTIENRALRVWYADRADIFVSSSVDFLTEPDHIIRLFLSFMYASEESMGWDSTIICDWNGNPAEEPQYKIKVQSAATKTSPSVVKWYRTTGLISAVGAEAVRGRGTRVWRVREILDNGTLGDKTCVLKDVWVDSDQPSEDEIIAKIKAAAEKMEDPREKEALLPCLLTPLISGPVLLEDGEVDDTIGDRKREHWYLPTQPRFHLTQVSVSEASSLFHLTPEPQSKVRSPRMPKAHKRTVGDYHKTHYRIVFEEVCEVLHEITLLERVVYALIKACLALKVLHKLGWVHRDISSGNILLFGDQVKIADFEYAKQMDMPGKERHDTRTGTDDFMAVEVRLCEFWFVFTEEEDPPQEELEVDITDAVLHMYPDEPIPSASPAPPPRIHQKYAWFYNPLHDLESIYWIFKSSVINKDIFYEHAPSGSTKQGTVVSSNETERQWYRRLIHHWNLSRVLFSGRSGRDRFAYLHGVLAEFLEEHPLHPAIEPLAEHLLEMRQALVARYRLIEKDPLTIDHTSAGTTHTTFMRLLREALYHLRRIPYDVHIRSLGPQVQSIPKSIWDEILVEDAKAKPTFNLTPSQTSKRSRETTSETDSERRSRSLRTRVSQTPPTLGNPAEAAGPINPEPRAALRSTVKRRKVLTKEAAFPSVQQNLRPRTRGAASAAVNEARPTVQTKGARKATDGRKAVNQVGMVAEKGKIRKGR